MGIICARSAESRLPQRIIPILFLTWPFLYLGIPTGIWGKTLGKLLCGLTVTDVQGRPPGIWRALGREVLKCLAIGSGICILLLLYQMIYQGGTWYDDLCGTRVEFKPPIARSSTQKNWHKYYKNR